CPFHGSLDYEGVSTYRKADREDFHLTDQNNKKDCCKPVGTDLQQSFFVPKCTWTKAAFSSILNGNKI
uniref:hypothetical protein n=1 Tax=Candidatus Fimivicinus sp. TaxID=3056640 RepID=UPI003FF13FDB